MLFHRLQVRVRQLDRAEFLLGEAVQRAGDGEAVQFRAHSTTFGTVKKPCAASGALARILSG